MFTVLADGRKIRRYNESQLTHFDHIFRNGLGQLFAVLSMIELFVSDIVLLTLRLHGKLPTFHAWKRVDLRGEFASMTTIIDESFIPTSTINISILPLYIDLLSDL